MLRICEGGSKIRSYDILVVTLSNKGGSWYSTKLLLDELRKKIGPGVIVCSGKPSYKINDKTIRHVYVNAVDINKIQRLFLKVPIISLFLFIPIGLCALFLWILYKPRVIIVNGVIPLLVFVPLKLFKRDTLIVLEYHGAIRGYIPKLLAKVLKIILNPIIDVAVVNSTGSYNDLSLIIDSSKILIQEHIADDEFFTRINREKARQDLNIKKDKFVITYVGHLTYEKGFDVFLRLMKRLITQKDIMFIVVGDGPLKKFIKYFEEKYNNVRYLGYISNRSLLHKCYTASDLVWSYADETYLARPAIEALASGTPVIIPDVPAVLFKRRKGRRIPRTLLPESIGFIVDHNDIESIAKLIINLAKNKSLLKYMSKRAYEYAQRKHSKLYLKVTVNSIVKSKPIIGAKAVGCRCEH